MITSDSFTKGAHFCNFGYGKARTNIFGKYVVKLMKQHTKYSSKDFSLCTHESDENRGNFEVLQITAHNVLRYFKLFVIDIVFVHVVKDSCRVKYVMNNIIVSKNIFTVILSNRSRNLLNTE